MIEVKEARSGTGSDVEFALADRQRFENAPADLGFGDAASGRARLQDFTQMSRNF